MKLYLGDRFRFSPKSDLSSHVSIAYKEVFFLVWMQSKHPQKVSSDFKFSVSNMEVLTVSDLKSKIQETIQHI